MSRRPDGHPPVAHAISQRIRALGRAEMRRGLSPGGEGEHVRPGALECPFAARRLFGTQPTECPRRSKAVSSKAGCTHHGGARIDDQGLSMSGHQRVLQRRRQRMDCSDTRPARLLRLWRHTRASGREVGIANQFGYRLPSPSLWPPPAVSVASRHLLDLNRPPHAWDEPGANGGFPPAIAACRRREEAPTPTTE